MAMISQETIDQVNRASDIVSVVGEYVQLERRGASWWGCCPFHSEKTPSFSVSPERNMYYCFGCHEGGSVVKFVMEMEKMKFPEAVALLAKKANVEMAFEGGGNPQRELDNTKELYVDLYSRVAGTFHYLLVQTEEGKFALDYIQKRGLTMDTIEKFRLGYAPADRLWLRKFLRSKSFGDEFLSKSGLFSGKRPDAAFFCDRLMFPIFDRRGQVVAFSGRFLRGDAEKSPKYINSRDLPQFKKGETLFAFNFAKAAIRAEKKVIICEGQMDCIAYHQCGILYAVAPGGTSLTESQIRIVKGYARTVYLSLDGDAAGQAATFRDIMLCRSFGLEVRVITMEGAKDPAEVMVAFGAAKLEEAVARALPDNEYLLSSLSRKHGVSTPEGKAAVAMEFFSYLDCIQSEIEKATNLERLGEFLSVPLDSIRKDFSGRLRAAAGPAQVRRSVAPPEGVARAPKKDAELKLILACVTDTKNFALLRGELSEGDFESPSARELFKILEECFGKGCLTQEKILSCCDNPEHMRLIAEAVSSREFSGDMDRFVRDGVSVMTRRALEKQRTFLSDEMKKCDTGSSEGRMILRELFAKKLEIDRKLTGKVR